MTREIILHCLKSAIDEENCENCKIYGQTGEDHCFKDAVRAAIEILEQDPSYNSIKTELEPCEDAISRQAVIDALTKTSGIRGDALKALYDLPSVTPQPKMGRWIMSDDGLYRPICNNCGAHPWKGYIPTVEEATEAFKYCPNCGAKMQEVEG